MQTLRAFWKSVFDVRPGEYLRVLFMSLNLFCVLWAYYLLKGVARAMFIDEFDIDKLPYLYILIAVAGGFLATLYTKVAVKTSLVRAVAWANGLAIACLIVLWWMLGRREPWMLYVLNVWMSLFSIILVSQGWLVAANLFNPREAKRLYGLLGVSQVVGAFLGGNFAAWFVRTFREDRHLFLASATMVILSCVTFLCIARLKGVNLAAAKAAEKEEAEFAFKDIVAALRRHRHLQVIMGITTVMFIVDVSIEFQFNAQAKAAFKGAELKAFMSSFYGTYINLVNFVFQFFLSALIVSKLGVGGVLQVMPVSISMASVASLLSPGVWAASAARLSESAIRYTFNKTGMELLYLPLPLELRNRTKAFIDVFIDRIGRGLGGTLILFCTAVLGFGPTQIPYLSLFFVSIWILLAWFAQKEYFQTVRGRLKARRLDLESSRLTLNDTATIAMLEQASTGPNARQAGYALTLLAEVPAYDLAAHLRKLTASPLDEVRAKVYELARAAATPALLEEALAEVHSGRSSAATNPAVAYALSVAPDPVAAAQEFIDSRDLTVAGGVIDAMETRVELRCLITAERLLAAVGNPEAGRRALAARAISICGDQNGLLRRLIADPDPEAASAACRAVGRLGERAYVGDVATRLVHSAVRGAAIEGLAAFGTRICGTLGDLLEDDSLPLPVRRQIPRALKKIYDQRSVDVLIKNIGQRDLGTRLAVLKALNHLRENVPSLDFHDRAVTSQIMNEARRYFELYAALEPFREIVGPRSATELLARTLDMRLEQIIERLFRLLGLRFPHREIYASYLALQQRHGEQHAAALEFLDNILDRDLKRVILPIVDSAGPMTVRGMSLFGVNVPGPEAAVQDLIQRADPWLVACACATAAEQKLRKLAPEVRGAAERSEAEVAEVARAAAAALT